VVEVESGNLLPGGGNLLPVLTEQDIALPAEDSAEALAALTEGLADLQDEEALTESSTIVPGLAAPAQASLLTGAQAGDPLAAVTQTSAEKALSGAAPLDQLAAAKAGSSEASAALEPLSTAVAPRPGAVTGAAEADGVFSAGVLSSATGAAEETSLVAASTSRLSDAVSQTASRPPGAQLTTAPATALAGQGEPGTLLRSDENVRLNLQPVVVSDEVTLEPLQTWSGADANAARSTASSAAAQPILGLAQPATESLQSARAPALVPLTVPPGEPEFTGELANRVSLMVKNGSQEASLQLNPPELGRLEIRIVTEGDQARIQFAVHNPDARDAIEQNLPRLREMLEQSGLQLARSDVADQSKGQQQSEATPSDVSLATEEDAEVLELTPQMDAVEGVLESGVDYYV